MIIFMDQFEGKNGDRDSLKGFKAPLKVNKK